MFVPSVPVLVRADDESKKSEQVTTVVTVVSDDSDKPGEKNVKRMVLQAVDEGMAGIIDRVRQQLDEAKVDAKTREKVMETLKKSLTERKGGHQGQVTVQVEADSKSGETKVDVAEIEGKVVMVDEKGNKREFELKRGEPLKLTPDGKFMFRELGSDIREELRKRFKEQGLDASMADKIAESMNWGSMFSGERLGQFNMLMDQPKFRLGVSLTSEDGKLLVAEVAEESPAMKAGVREGDVVVSANGKEISDTQGLIAMVQEAGAAGKEVELKVQRGESNITFEIAPQESESIISAIPGDLRMRLRQLPQGMGGGLVIPQMEGEVRGMMGGVMAGGAVKELKELRGELEALKTELSEIKEMLRALKK